MITANPFALARLLDAPRGLVYRHWTEPSHMTWWGPKEVTVGRIVLDLRPGGRFHYCMTPPEGPALWGKWAIREVAEPERLVFVNSFSDEAGATTRHPMSATWPLEMLSTITFEKQGEKTLLTIRWEPLNATETEIETFNSGHDSMRNGWGGSLDRLAIHLAAPASVQT